MSIWIQSWINIQLTMEMKCIACFEHIDDLICSLFDVFCPFFSSPPRLSAARFLCVSVCLSHKHSHPQCGWYKCQWTYELSLLFMKYTSGPYFFPPHTYWLAWFSIATRLLFTFSEIILSWSRNLSVGLQCNFWHTCLIVYDEYRFHLSSSSSAHNARHCCYCMEDITKW